MKKLNANELYFLPLGGSNEIGMNVNLYHYKGKWIMIDLGAGFAGDKFPGIQMLAPDLSYVEEIIESDNFLGVILTHAHEDHVGSVGYVWDQIRCLIWATPFTAGMVHNKLEQEGWDREAKVNIVQPGSRFSIGPFDLEMVHITHSIPEMNGIIIRTEHGNVLHTGDWKFDPTPVIGDATDFDKLKKIGDEGLLALVCDSTNVFNDRFSGSEGDLLASLTQLISDQRGMVMVTTFASNLARLQTIAQAAKNCGRKVAVAGWSIRRIEMIARDTGYLKDIDPFLHDKEIAHHPRDKMLVICTGCQGETNAATSKIASQNHPTIRITPKDSVIFSSKIIPGNEKKIFALFNQFVRLGCEVFTEKDHFVHVSGHPSAEELKRMYELTRPQIAVPVHGEPMHLHEHAKLARKCGVPKTLEVQNGLMVRLAPGEPKQMGMYPSGYLGVDGKFLHPIDGDVLRKRRKMMNVGIVFVVITMTSTGNCATKPVVRAPGLVDEDEFRGFFKETAEGLMEIIDAQYDSNTDIIRKMSRKHISREFLAFTGKEPYVEVEIIRV